MCGFVWNFCIWEVLVLNVLASMLERLDFCTSGKELRRDLEILV